MRSKLLFSAVVLASLLMLTWSRPRTALAGELGPSSGYKVLAPIQHGNLTIFPVAAAKSYDSRDFLNLV